MDLIIRNARLAGRDGDPVDIGIQGGRFPSCTSAAAPALLVQPQCC